MIYNLGKFKEEKKEIEEWLRKEYSQIHTGQATPVLLDPILVDSYGSKMPIKNMASINIEDAKTLRVSPWDKSQVQIIEKAIQAFNLGLSVIVDNAGLRVIFPQLTTERRISLVKILKEKLEEARVSLRVQREKIWNDIQQKEKNKEMPEDDKFRAKEDLQNIVDDANKSLEAIFNKKENEVTNQ